MSLQARITRAARERSLAFTLMEMLIVIAIMLLLVIATLPRIKQTLEDSKLRESSRQLNSYIAMAKSRAAATGRPCGIWLVSEQLGDPSATPGTFQTTQLYLAEIPPLYSGDVVEARVVVTDSAGENWGRINSGMTMATSMQGPPWSLNFPAASAGSLFTLIADGEFFAIRFDGKETAWIGYRSGNAFLLNGQTNPPTSGLTYPPTANANAGYSYQIVRNPRRIGAPLNLPRGTCIDLAYSGFGNYGAEFYSSINQVMVLFTPEGRVGNVTYQTYTGGNPPYPLISNEAQGTVHFLVGRPEKVGLALPQSNLFDNNALWVSIGRLTGSVVTTENAPDNTLPYSTAAEQRVFLTTAREFAITQDVKGGQ